MEIWFASGNTHKRRELAYILQTALAELPEAAGPAGLLQEALTLTIPCEAGIVFDPEENGSTFFENALIKAQALYEITGKPVIADDSGLCVEALGGLPGIFSARYRGKDAGYSTAGGEKLTDSSRNNVLLHELEGEHNRRACFVCCMVLYTGNHCFYAAQQTLEGFIVEAGRGTGGFGYDPLLYLPEAGKTVAELTEAEKNRLSHRGKAGRAIARFLHTLADSRGVFPAPAQTASAQAASAQAALAGGLGTGGNSGRGAR